MPVVGSRGQNRLGNSQHRQHLGTDRNLSSSERGSENGCGQPPTGHLSCALHGANRTSHDFIAVPALAVADSTARSFVSLAITPARTCVSGQAETSSDP